MRRGSSRQLLGWEVERTKRENQQRLENAKKMAENRVRARQDRLRVIQGRDREVEERLLFEWMDEKSLSETSKSGPWFVSEDMSGERNYILQYMGTYIKQHWNKKTLEVVEKLVNNMEWIKQPFRGHLADTESLNSIRGYERATILQDLSMDGGNMHDREHTPLFMSDRIWDHIKAAFSLLGHLGLLRRLTDGNNPEASQKPLPDGTNLEFPALRSSWVLHRAWIRALHYRSLRAGPHGYGVRQLYHILALSMILLDGEAARTENGSPELKDPPEFQALIDCAQSLIVALNGVLSDLLTESRPIEGGVPYSHEETIVFNVESGLLPSIYKANFGPVNKLWQLWAYLLCLSDEFNRRMDREHVEDSLMSKRIVVTDEFWDLSLELAGGHEPLNWNLLYSSDFEDEACSVLRKISQVNRYRRDFLLLRDWSHRRPWRQLYYVFDTSDGEQDYFIEPINLFYSEIDRLVEHERTDPECKYKFPNPSSKANIWGQLFQIHPVSSTEPETSPLKNCNYDGGCAICQESFKPTFIIVRLHCSHLYHYTCIRTMWDQPGVYTFSCPVCRTDSVKWSLHEQAGIIPEVADVWDNEISVGQNLAREHPNVSEENDFYWMWENERLARSGDWNDIHGDEPRDIMIEMAHVRRARRRRNARLRTKVSLRDNIGGLDPST